MLVMANTHANNPRDNSIHEHQQMINTKIRINYILCSWRCSSSIQSAKARVGADCGSDHRLLIAKCRLNLKKAGKTTRPFRYDLSQIPYDYIMEVKNRFEGLDLIDRVPKEPWMEVHNLYRRQWPKPSQRKRHGCLKKLYKQLRKEEKWKVKEKRKDIPNWMQSSKEQQGEKRKSS